MAKILLADDDDMVCLVVSEQLKAQGFIVDVAQTAADTQEYLKAFSYDLIIVDWEFPDGSGISIIESYRKSGGLTPLLMLTGKTEIDHKTRGLEAGADDYVGKPFQERELLARVRALLRRPCANVREKLQIADLSIDRQSRQAWRGEREVRLQPVEFEVLEFFMLHSRTVYSVKQILQILWTDNDTVSSEAIYTCINRLRRKLEEPEKQAIFNTIPGKGYELIL